MRNSIYAGILIAGTTLWLGSGVGWCADEADHETPPVPGEIPDKGPPRQEITDKATALGLSEDRVETMRANGMGWGEIDIAEDLATRMVETSTTEPKLTGDQAMDQILQLRADGLGWGQIAHTYDVKLGHVAGGHKDGVIEDDGGIDNDGISDPVGAEHGQPGKSGHDMKADHPDHSQRPDKLDRIGRPDGAGKPEKVDQHGNGKPDHAGKPDSDHGGKPDKTGKPDHAGNPH